MTSVRYCRRTRATRCVSRNLCQLLHNCENKLHNTRARLTALCPGLPRSAGTRKVKPIWISLKQETLSGSGISWTICKSVPSSRQITTPAPHRSVFLQADTLPAAQPTVSKHWMHQTAQKNRSKIELEHYSRRSCSKLCARWVNSPDTLRRVINKLDRRRVLLTTWSTCRGEISVQNLGQSSRRSWMFFYKTV